MHAAPFQRNLGDDLVYFRVRALPGDLPAEAAIEKRPAIVDVRFAQGDAGAASVLDSWLKFHASHQHPILVLANAATSAAILAVLHDADSPAVLTLGVAGHHFAPAIAVAQSPAEERKAYQALDDGATVASLVSDHPDKPRNDEASLTKPAEDALGDDIAPDESENAKAARPAAPIDAALQRAIQILRGLKAMKAF